MTVYPLLVGSGGKKFIEATGGTIFQQTIDSITYNVHRFDPGTSGDFVISFAPGGSTVDVIMWGAAGGRSGSGAGNDGGGGAYARTSALSITQETLNVSVGGGGSTATGGCTTGNGAAGGTGPLLGRGGNGMGAGTGGCSGAGGGGGGGTFLLRSGCLLYTSPSPRD